MADDFQIVKINLFRFFKCAQLAVVSLALLAVVRVRMGLAQLPLPAPIAPNHAFVVRYVA